MNILFEQLTLTINLLSSAQNQLETLEPYSNDFVAWELLSATFNLHDLQVLAWSTKPRLENVKSYFSSA
jgi:hypothetical protein